MSSWYPFYYDDYERDAGHLDHVSDSCYRRIIDFYMRTREPIPRDPIRLMHITRCSADQFATVWPRLEGFFTEVDGYLHLKRCNIELDRQDARQRYASHAGKKSAEKRKQQYQLLINDRSTTVQPLLNDRSTSRATTGQDKTEQREDHNKNYDAGASFRQRLFNGCLDWLVARSNRPEAECRSLIGKWLAQTKNNNDDGAAVFQAFAAAQRAEKGDGAFEPVSYITATLKPKSKRRTEQMPL